MMKWLKDFAHGATALMLATAVTGSASLAADQDNNQNRQGRQAQQKAQQGEGQQAQRQNDDRDRRKLQVFELQHRDPQQLTQLINLWDQVSTPAQATYARTVEQQAGGHAQDAKDKVAIAMDSEKKLLFARGSEEQLEKLQSLIQAVDVEDDKLETHDFANHRLIPIHGKDASRVQSMLMQLELTGQMLRLGDCSLITYRVGDDEEEDEKLQQAEEVIKKLNERQRDADKEDDQEDSKNKNGNASDES